MQLTVRNACENNLRSVSLALPKNQLVLVTGVSGSGKTSLVLDVIYREAEARYLGSFSAYARQFLARFKRPEVEAIDGLSPAICVDQSSLVANPRSTVGTLTEIYDALRLLFARAGSTEVDGAGLPLTRSLFSFNSPLGACPVCKGLGVEDRLDPELLIADENKSLRQGCMVITAPNGYVIYSQVTMDVLDEVCRAEGFSTDIPWKDLTPAQRHIVLYGSEKIEIPYGKHPLESRMRWAGITAKPREVGYYKGILAVMETILERSRNKNILRFVRTTSCSACNGARLNPRALAVKVGGWNIAQLAALPLSKLDHVLRSLELPAAIAPIHESVVSQIGPRIGLLTRLGLGYLSLDRESTTLSAGEGQRLRLAVQAGTDLSGILYVFDEPSVGLHPRDTGPVIELVKDLRDRGNSVLVIEHEEEFLRHADWLVELGPGAGVHGGRLLINAPICELPALAAKDDLESPTLAFFSGRKKIALPRERRAQAATLVVHGAAANNLKVIDARFSLGAVNAVTGVSGAGKTTLVHDVLGNALRAKLGGESHRAAQCASVTGSEQVQKIVEVDQSPIGRTPRSNPATYTGLFDDVRKLFATTIDAQERGWDKGRFSFNTAGGRCEACQGAGYQQIGMHFLGNVEVLCDACNGKRFGDDTLGILYRDKNISQVLDLSIAQAREFFAGNERIVHILETLDSLGLGYLTLGQRSSTLSGGEAQRVKLATELAKSSTAHTLYLLDEPTTGLHQADVGNLLTALQALVHLGNTVIVIEHHLALIAAADWVVDLGPSSGDGGGQIVAQGTPEQIAACPASYTGQALQVYLDTQSQERMIEPLPQRRGPPEVGRRDPGPHEPGQHDSGSIHFGGVTTNNLKHIDVDIGRGSFTVLTGVSGSGKSSFAFDTLFAEGQHRFMQSYSSYARAQIGMNGRGQFETSSGLTPTIAVDQRSITENQRSTVGTFTGIYDLVRLLYSRAASPPDTLTRQHSSLFSFNHHAGACPGCDGMGMITLCDPDRVITDPGKSILTGAMDGTRTGAFYGDSFGQYVASLKAVGERHGIDFTAPWAELGANARDLAMHGGGEEVYAVNWKFKRGERTGEHHFEGKWQGLAALVEAEYQRKHADHRGQSLLPLMKHAPCPTCHGTRLKAAALQYTFFQKNVAELAALPMTAALSFFENAHESLQGAPIWPVAQPLVTEITRRIRILLNLGLGYLALDRASSSLSGGEAQRVKLATHLGGGLGDITYVLDEPTAGLHGADVQKLLTMLRSLQRAGNTVVVVEHDRQVIRSADRVIELGPGAGHLGGAVVATGSPAQLQANPASLTAQYLSDTWRARPSPGRVLAPGLTIVGANANNLKILDVVLPSGGIVAVTGVSGSGKSTLVFDVIEQSAQNQRACGCTEISGLDRFESVRAVLQKSKITTSLGTPATFAGMFDAIRTLFAHTESSRRAHLQKKHFSFLDKEGRCPTCQGLGQIQVSMDFLADVSMMCTDCQGSRYRKEILACRYHDKNISDVLNMTVSQAQKFFAQIQTVSAPCLALEQVGLGYLQLGQPLDTLSGGETQRLTLAVQLTHVASGPRLYLFDEPSCGLHFADIDILLDLFDTLVERGHTVLMVEHDPQMIAHADWVIDLGPEGGDRGGYLVAQGKLSDIVRHPNSVTGRFLHRRMT